MLTKFFKYQSLGNDFILFDWYNKQEIEINKIIQTKSWSKLSCKLCDRNFGIGSDGIFILKKNIKDNIPEGIIFNSDGTKAEICLNGLRCMAKHLYDFHNFPNKFKVKMGPKKINCFIEKTKDELIITTQINSAKFIGKKTIFIENEKISGCFLDIGNPHFVIFEKTNLNWLKKNGKLIESHTEFKNKTNVEFVWKTHNKNNFKTLIYERGSGITLACSSGAVCIIMALLNKNWIKKGEKVLISMPGGKIDCWIDNKNNTYLKSTSRLVFEGKLVLEKTLLNVD